MSNILSPEDREEGVCTAVKQTHVCDRPFGARIPTVKIKEANFTTSNGDIKPCAEIHWLPDGGTLGADCDQEAEALFNGQQKRCFQLFASGRCVGKNLDSGDDWMPILLFIASAFSCCFAGFCGCIGTRLIMGGSVDARDTQ